LEAVAYSRTLSKHITFTMLQVGWWLAKHDYELRCSVINAIQENSKTYLLGEHVDEEWWIVLSCQSVLWI